MEGVANRSTGREVNEDNQVGQTSVGLGKAETHTGSLDESIGGLDVTNVRAAEGNRKRNK